MAQSTHQSPSSGGRTNRIYFDNPITLQMPISDEHPEGEVRVFKQGWNEVPPELMDHPIIRRMRPENENEGQRRQQVLDAEREKAEAISKAEVDYTNKLREVEKSRNEEIQQRSEERAKRVAEADAKGEVFHEPHPDPDAEHAIALTQDPSAHVVSASGMAYKGDESVAGGQRRVRESGYSENLGGQPAQGGSGYSRQDQAHRTTAPVRGPEGEPAGTNKDEMTGVNTTGASTTTSSSSSTTPPPARSGRS